MEVNNVKKGNGMKVMDFHGYIKPELEVEKVHKFFDNWGIYDAVSIVDFIEDDICKAIQQAKSSRIRNLE